MNAGEAKAYVWNYLTEKKQHKRYKRDAITRFFKKAGIKTHYDLKEVDDFLSQEKI